MRGWLVAQWKEYLDSADPELSTSVSSPGMTALTVCTMCGIFVGLEYVPFLARLSNFEGLWGSVALACSGGILSTIAWKRGCRDTVGRLSTLLDNTLYSSALAYAAIHSVGGVALAIALIHVIFSLFPGQIYSFTWPFAVTIAAPLLAMMVAFHPPTELVIALGASTLGMLSMSKWTRTRREVAKRQRELEAALSAAHKLADESVQAALTTTLLTLGNFLHELRNYQTAISADLDFVRSRATLSEQVSAALDDALAAQRRQEELVRHTVADLRSRARPVESSFLLSDAIRQLQADFHGVELAIQEVAHDFEIHGNQEHLHVVLLNLVRNAEQAGAARVSIETSLEPSGHASQILLQDDGPGVPSERREQLFDSFAVSSKPGGSGLGMYLVRRYVELLGGRVTLEAASSGGLAARIRLPGSIRYES